MVIPLHDGTDIVHGRYTKREVNIIHGRDYICMLVRNNSRCIGALELNISEAESVVACLLEEIEKAKNVEENCETE